MKLKTKMILGVAVWLGLMAIAPFTSDPFAVFFVTFPSIFIIEYAILMLSVKVKNVDLMELNNFYNTAAMRRDLDSIAQNHSLRGRD